MLLLYVGADGVKVNVLADQWLSNFILCQFKIIIWSSLVYKNCYIPLLWIESSLFSRTTWLTAIIGINRNSVFYFQKADQMIRVGCYCILLNFMTCYLEILLLAVSPNHEIIILKTSQ